MPESRLISGANVCVPLTARIDSEREAVTLAMLHEAGLDGHVFQQLHVPLPPGAEEYLNPLSRRLLDLREEYARFGGPAATVSRWGRLHVEADLPILQFRSDCAFVWQRRENTLANYLLTARYINTGKGGWLLQKLEEDGLFGAQVVLGEHGLAITRDRLDSVLEITFIDRLLKLSDGTPKTILDIGAGYGRFGHRLTEAFPNASVLCTDAVAEATFVCEYYLAFRSALPRARAIPLHDLSRSLDRANVDLAVNIHSFSECTFEAIEWWLDLLRERSIRYVLILPNAEEHRGTELLSFEPGGVRRDFLSAVEARGYERIACDPKYDNADMQRYGGVSPTYYHLFELKNTSRHDRLRPACEARADVAVENGRFMPEEIDWLEDGFGLVRATGRSVTLPADSYIRDIFARWKQFASLDEMAMSVTEGPNFLSLSAQHQENLASARDACLRRFLAGIIARLQLRMYRNNAVFRRVRVALTELAALGAFVSDVRLIDACNKSHACTSPTLVTSIGFDEDDYTSHFREMYLAFLANARRFGRSVRIFAVAGGKPPVGDVQCTSSTARVRNTSAILFRGMEARRAVAKQMELEGVPPRVARFAVFGHDRVQGCRGANRNAILFWTAGECVLFSPTRVLGSPFSKGPYDRALILRQNAFAEGSWQKVRWANPSEGEASLDVLAIHERLLGRPLTELVAEYSKRASVSFTKACSHMIDSIRRGEGRICATLVESVKLGPRNRALVYGHPSHTIFHEAPCATDCFALDARSLVPPFWPCGLGSMQIFFSLMARCWRDSFFGQLPWVSPASTIADSERVVSRPGTITLIDLVDICITSAQEPISFAPADRLKEMGGSLASIASLRASDLEELLRLGLWRRMSDKIAHIEQQLTQWPREIALREELRLWLGAYRDLSSGPGIPRPSDVLPGAEQMTVSNTLRDLLSLFGQLLQYWPDIFGSGQRINAA